MKIKKKEKRSSPRFFFRIQVETCAQLHTQVKLLGKYIPPIPSGFGTPGSPLVDLVCR